MRRAPRMPLPRYGQVAAVVQRLAVLLSAGVEPLSAWRHLAADPAIDAPLVDSVAATRLGSELPDAVAEAAGHAAGERAAWSAVAATWAVAVEVGAPLAATLDRLAELFRGFEQASREVELALAGPRATARLVLALPPLGLLVGLALGVDSLRVLLATPIGIACLLAGVGLLLAARRWNGRLIAAARDLDPTPGLALELLAVGLSGGASAVRARGLVDAVLERFGIAGLGADARELLDFAAAAGVPAAGLLRAQALERRRAAGAEAQRRAVLLGTRLLLPLGLCVLPAFVLLGVVPVVIALVSTTVSGW